MVGCYIRPQVSGFAVIRPSDRSRLSTEPFCPLSVNESSLPANVESAAQSGQASGILKPFIVRVVNSKG